uniref:NADH-ubiquinone oxidoreductase chain 5 n=1 Tax=Melittomma sp. MEL01 TaxID=1205634 RepID=A0A0S2MPQ7_9CUCU|nr:NADH deshydrogenase subunit 5 [Melittomma sp. MEL01]
MSFCKTNSFLLLSFSLSFFTLGVYFVLFDFLYLVELEFLSLGSVLVLMTLLFDWMSFLFMSFVLFISSMVIFYSEEYMAGDLNLNRFIVLVMLFVASMALLIVSPNLISILLGWDGLGLVSYCLVIYYQNVKSFSAGMLTILSNRIGDVALLLSIAWMFNYGSWNYMFYLNFMLEDYWGVIIMLLIVLAGFTKSAQIPFSAWLPAAMAAPTPVSSLVHSSTLVTAGVYLLIRFSSCFNIMVSSFVVFFAMITMFMSGLGANFEFDLKKIIALSTLSQLGLMMSVLFMGSPVLAFFHLLIHALFKALLFMCAGNVIHMMMGVQDIRLMGGLSVGMPLTCSFLNVSNLSLCGLPFLAGFYSKDLAMEFMSMGVFNFFVYLVFYFSAGLTVSYSFRLFYYLNLGVFNFGSLNFLGDANYMMNKGMGGLFSMVCLMGGCLTWLIFDSFFLIVLSSWMKFLVLGFILLGMLVGVEISKFFLGYFNYGLWKTGAFGFLSSMWNLPVVSTTGSIYYPVYWGGELYSSLDQGWFEFYGSQGLFSLLVSESSFLSDLFVNSLKLFFFIFQLWVLCYYLV